MNTTSLSSCARNAAYSPLNLMSRWLRSMPKGRGQGPTIPPRALGSATETWLVCVALFCDLLGDGVPEPEAIEIVERLEIRLRKYRRLFGCLNLRHRFA